MKQNWVLIGALLAILAVPFGLAMFEDATRELPETAADQLEVDDAEPEYPEPDIDADSGSETVVEWERTDPVDLDAISEHLSSGYPGLRGELETAAGFGEPLSDAARRFEARFNAEHGPDLTVAIEPDPNLYTGGPVVSVGFAMPPNPAILGSLRQRWGAPASSELGGPCAMWASPESPLRAVLTMRSSPWTLSLSRYRPLDELLAAGAGGALGLEPSPLVGASIDDLEARHGDSLIADESGSPTYTLLATPAAASREPTLPITLLVSGGVVTEISATVDLSCAGGAADRARELLESSVGPVADSARLGEAEELRFEGRPDVSAFVYRDRVIIIRRR